MTVRSLLLRASASELAIPDFQREFIWKPQKIKALLESLGSGYYSGSLLFLATEAHSPVRLFTPRQIRGARSKPQKGATLVLDGQQRVTSLYYAATGPDAPLNDKHAYPVRFFVDTDALAEKQISNRNGIQAFMDLEGVFTFYRSNQKKADRLVDSRQLAPLASLLQITETPQQEKTLKKWLSSFDDETSFSLEKLRDAIFAFEFPFIEIPPTEDAEFIISCFTRINEGGTPLSRFDLAHARLKTKKVDMRSMWQSATIKKGNLRWARQNKWITDDALLQAFALASGKTPKAGDIFELIGHTSGPKASKLLAAALSAINDAIAELRGPLCVVEPSLLPTPAIIPALGVILRECATPKSKQKNQRKIHAWYWSAVLTGRYASAVNTNAISDVRQVRQWIKGGALPSWMRELTASDISHAWNRPTSPQYRAGMTALVANGLRDLLTDEKIAGTRHRVQDDHIFCKSEFGSRPGIHSLPNRMLLTQKTNGGAGKGDMLPSEFAALLDETYSSEKRLDSNLELACIPLPDGWDAMCEDDYDAFNALRGEALRKFFPSFLEGKLGHKLTSVDSGEDEVDWDEDDEDDGDDEDDDA